MKTPWPQSASLAPTNPLARPRSSLSQPVVLGGKAPPAVPLVQHHQPAVDRMEQLQGVPLGVLCGSKKWELQTRSWSGLARSQEDGVLSLPVTSPHQGLCLPHSLESTWNRQNKRRPGYVLFAGP